MSNFVKKILTSEYVNLAALLTFLAAITTMAVNALTTFFTERTKRKQNATTHLNELYNANRNILPELRLSVFDLHIKYCALNSCDYLCKTNKRCSDSCSRSILLCNYRCRTNRKCLRTCNHSIFPDVYRRKIEHQNILYLLSLSSETLTLHDRSVMGDSADKNLNEYRSSYITDFILAAEKFKGSIDKNGFPRWRKKHVKELSKLYYNISLMLQVKDSPDISGYCIRLLSLSTVKKYLSRYG